MYKVISKGPALCIRCGKPAHISAHITSAATDREPAEFKRFCENCAEQGVRDLPPCLELIACAISRYDAPRSTEKIRRRFRVFDLDERENLAAIGELSEDNAIAGQSFTIRYDMIPTRVRAIGATFTMTGTSLEVKVFERSGPK